MKTISKKESLKSWQKNEQAPQLKIELAEDLRKIYIQGFSLLELKEQVGVGQRGFLSDWWKDEAFAREKPEPGYYIFNFDKNGINKTYDEQLVITKDIPHPALLAEAILTNYRLTGEWVLKYWYSSTTTLYSRGSRIIVGYCYDRALHVRYWLGHRLSYVGVGAVRKFGEDSQKLPRYG